MTKIFFIDTPSNEISILGHPDISTNLTKTFNLKAAAQQSVTGNQSVDAIRSWKLTALYIGKRPWAMLLKGNRSALLTTGDFLEGYQVQSIDRNSISFSSEGKDFTFTLDSQTYSQKNKPAKKASVSFSIPKNYLKEELSKPERLLKDVSVLPVMENNIFGGLKINNLRYKSFLYIFGLRVGDVLKGVNNKPFKSLPEAIDLYNKLPQYKNITLNIVRNNKPMNLQYAIQ